MNACSEEHLKHKTPRQVELGMDAAIGRIPIHQPTLKATSSMPTTVEVGTTLPIDVVIACPAGCDLRGTRLLVVAPDGTVTSYELGACAEQVHEVGCAIAAPPEVGDHDWKIVFPRHETEHCIHEESSLPISFATKPHIPSMAVWDVPSPVSIDSAFHVKVGVTCPITCRLAGQFVEVRDECCAKVGEGRLSGAPRPGTTSLYWADVELTAPATEGLLLWTAVFPAALSPLAHEEVSTRFSFRAARRPEHRVLVHVIAKDSGLPLDDAEVRLGVYEAWTDDQGMVTVEVPKGAYELSIRKDGYSAPETSVDVTGASTVTVEASAVLTKAEREDRMRRYEDVWGEADW
jgi:hypothetical protein